MKYQHFTKIHGDSISATLLKLRNQYGERWTDNMASYAIKKNWLLPSVSWREPSTSGIPYTKKTFVQI